jgi:ATP-dependent Clp protease ATP-binding subunit ClpA
MRLNLVCVRQHDNKGRLVDCSKALFVLTSNLGTDEVDFRTTESDELRALAERIMHRELVNRITGATGFRPLERTHLAKILDHILAETQRGAVLTRSPFHVAMFARIRA